MGTKDRDEDKAGEAASDGQGQGKAGGFDEVKSTVADRIHKVAEALRAKATEQDPRSGAAEFRNQAAEWLEQSAGYIRQFDYKQADTGFREYVKQSPGRSLLIAGSIGLIAGTLWRHR